MPAISVLLPVRNASPHLRASLASLFRQTFADFEVIAVNDGSTDDSGEILDRAARRDRRLRVVHSPARGLPAALNLALAGARAPLVARHDADDLSQRRRFELQRAYLERDADTAVVGCRLRLFPRSEVGVGMKRWERWHNALLTHRAMAREVLIDSPLAHASAMVRSAWLERVGGWHDRGWAEDLDLWIRLIEAGARFAKLRETLYAWRRHPASATHRDSRYHRDRFMKLKLEALGRGILRGASELTLVGVGTSLERWREVLARVATIRSHVARAPEAAMVAKLDPPIVLVYTAASTRERWRNVLEKSGLIEGKSFIFVA
jgi:glycosyltransferase involved in cell wall biosynthesis